MKQVRHAFPLRADALLYTRVGLRRIPGRYIGVRSYADGRGNHVRYRTRPKTANGIARWLMYWRRTAFTVHFWRAA